MPVIQKVTDPAKVVTDPLVLGVLAEQGIDPEFVEFFQDYAPRSLGKEHGPYAKFYRDLKSGKRFMVTSGLPMVNADGVKVHVGWEKIGNTYRSLPNQFFAQVIGRRVLLRLINDQPDGTKKNNQAVWEPQLFLNGVEQTCGAAVLLDLDPYNENYHQNVLEWDYGVCKRRIRIIEGRFRERWLFESNPHGDIRIKHNFTGSLKLNLGYAQDAEGKEFKVTITDDEEIVEASEFDKTAYPDEVVYPVEIGAGLTVYPDASIHNTTVDGHVGRQTSNDIWADVVLNPGNANDATSVWTVPYFIQTNTVPGGWWNNRRFIATLDATGLPAAAVIDSAEFDLRGRSPGDGGLKVDNLGITPNANIYGSTPASDNVLVNADYGETGTTPFCDTPITFAGWAEGYNVFALNAAGIAAISKVLMTKFSAQNANYDVAERLDPGNHAPNWTATLFSYMAAYPADKGSGYKPKLVITYHLIIEGSANGEGIGEAETVGIRAAVGQPSGSGIGLATSEAKLNVLAQALGNGIGLSEATSYLIIPAEASGQGVGLGASAAYLIVLAQAEASGIGTGLTDALLDVLAEAQGSGVGLGLADSYLIIPASALGSGNGEGLAEALLIVLAQAEASGIGLAEVEGIRAAVGIALGSGIGTGTSQALLDVLAQMSGHGIGIGKTSRTLLVVLIKRGAPIVHDLGKMKPDYTLGYPLPQVDYTIGKVKKGSHNLGRKV